MAIAGRALGAALAFGATATTIATIFGPTHDAYAQSFFSSFWGKLDAHELGTWNYLEKAEASGTRTINNLISANAVTLGHRQQGMDHDHSDHLRLAQCKMIQMVNGFYKHIGASNPRNLEYPDSLQWRRAFIRELKSFSGKLEGYQLCSDVPQSILSQMYNISYRYYKTRKDFISSIENRSSRYSDQEWATAISAEIPGIPFKFEFINGELKLKLSRSFGGLKFDGQIGPTSKRSGIKTVRIYTETKAIIYEIGKKPVTFEVPSSTITFDDDTVTIIYK